eukprot:GEMP01130830.1.p1 GENE.GEMP01130830.1~~GEMP01130830.1.p1  ORF type:complete len:108 (+),score=16.68 GEMP01130830.1:1-324(+)
MHQMGQNFHKSLQQLSFDNDQKYELMCGILGELQNRQHTLEATVQRIQAQRQKMKQQQTNNLYAAAYYPVGMVMPMMSGAFMMGSMPMIMGNMIPQEMVGAVPAEAN